MLTINGEPMDLTGGRGYIEKDWGTSFPSAWIWMQCNTFDTPDTSFMLSYARIPWMGSHFWESSPSSMQVAAGTGSRPIMERPSTAKRSPMAMSVPYAHGGSFDCTSLLMLNVQEVFRLR